MKDKMQTVFDKTIKNPMRSMGGRGSDGFRYTSQPWEEKGIMRVMGFV